MDFCSYKHSTQPSVSFPSTLSPAGSWLSAADTMMHPACSGRGSWNVLECSTVVFFSPFLGLPASFQAPHLCTPCRAALGVHGGGGDCPSCLRTLWAGVGVGRATGSGPCCNTGLAHPWSCGKMESALSPFPGLASWERRRGPSVPPPPWAASVPGSPPPGSACRVLQPHPTRFSFSEPGFPAGVCGLQSWRSGKKKDITS